MKAWFEPAQEMLSVRDGPWESPVEPCCWYKVKACNYDVQAVAGRRTNSTECHSQYCRRIYARWGELPSVHECLFQSGLIESLEMTNP